MKKIVAIMAVVISAGAFANGHMNHSENNNNTNHSRGRCNGQMTRQLESLTTEQQDEFNALHSEHMDSMKLARLNMKEIDLQIQKEMLAEKPNQTNLNKLIDKKSDLQAEMRKEALNFKLEMKEKYDLDIRGNMGHHKNGMSKSNHKNNNNHNNHIG